VIAPRRADGIPLFLWWALAVSLSNTGGAQIYAPTFDRRLEDPDANAVHLTMADKYCRLAARASEWMARTEDIPQFLKGTANADEAWFSLSALSQPTQEKFQNKNPDRALPPTQIIERIHRRTNLLTNFGFWIDVLKSFNQRGIFGTQFFAQFVNSLKQLIEFLGITRLVSSLHLGTELGHLAIDSGLGLVAADYFEDLLRVRLVTFAGVGFWACAYTGAVAITKMVTINFRFTNIHSNMPPAMMMPSRRKVTK
jgi:hypothetical protein